MKFYAILFFILGSLFLFAQENQRYINVNGTAEVKIPADQAEFNVQLRVVEETIEESKKKVDNSLKNLLNLLNSLKINKEDIEVNPAMLGKNYEYNQTGRVEKGYFASISIQFTLKDLSKYYELSNGLAKEQTIEIVNSSFSLSDYEKHGKEAYIKALKAAAAKADYIAKTLGIKTGKILEVDEFNQNQPMPFNTMAMEKSDAGVSISGKVQISRTVRVKYEIID